MSDSEDIMTDNLDRVNHSVDVPPVNENIGSEINNYPNINDTYNNVPQSIFNQPNPTQNTTRNLTPRDDRQQHAFPTGDTSSVPVNEPVIQLLEGHIDNISQQCIDSFQYKCKWPTCNMFHSFDDIKSAVIYLIPRTPMSTTTSFVNSNGQNIRDRIITLHNNANQGVFKDTLTLPATM